MFEEMGQTVDNAGAPFWDAAVNGWIFLCSRGTPPKHDDSPPMTQAQVAAVVNAAPNGEMAWQNAMPPLVKTWMQTRPPQQRAEHLQGCLELKALGPLL